MNFSWTFPLTQEEKKWEPTVQVGISNKTHLGSKYIQMRQKWQVGLKGEKTNQKKQYKWLKNSFRRNWCGKQRLNRTEQSFLTSEFQHYNRRMLLWVDHNTTRFTSVLLTHLQQLGIKRNNTLTDCGGSPHIKLSLCTG